MTKPFYLSNEAIVHFVNSALAEDIGEGDHSTMAAIPSDLMGKSRLLIKENGVIAGIELAEIIFKILDPNLQVNLQKKDGEIVKKGEVAFEVSGAVRSILSTERLVLNCMQRMSGIASYTHHLSKIIEGTHARLMDTRKTTPNFRLMEKWAVLIGGGLNHRYALYDMIMLKDNHIDMAGSIEKAITNTKRYLNEIQKSLKIEIETRSLDEVKEVIRVGGVDVIMLDNMTTAQMREAVEIIDQKFMTEASGGITEANLKAVADCGVDFISVGALTHSVKSLDLSLKVVQ